MENAQIWAIQNIIRELCTAKDWLTSYDRRVSNIQRQSTWSAGKRDECVLMCKAARDQIELNLESGKMKLRERNGQEALVWAAWVNESDKRIDLRVQDAFMDAVRHVHRFTPPPPPRPYGDRDEYKAKAAYVADGTTTALDGDTLLAILSRLQEALTLLVQERNDFVRRSEREILGLKARMELLTQEYEQLKRKVEAIEARRGTSNHATN